MAFQFIQDSGEKGTTPHTWNIKATGHRTQARHSALCPKGEPCRQTCSRPASGRVSSSIFPGQGWHRGQSVVSHFGHSL